MAKTNNLYAGVTEPEKVNQFLDQLEHPLKDVVTRLREIILSTDKEIGEGIYWNAPTFFFTGILEPFEPKTYKRYLVGFNFYQKDCIRLLFLHGASAINSNELLSGDYKDGRRLASFGSLEEVKTNEDALRKILLELISQMKKLTN